MVKRQDIRIRDPFIFVDFGNKKYYMYGTTSLKSKDSLAAKDTFSCYVSEDLENFEGPFVVFDGKAQEFWGTRDYWAPEVHFYHGKYYLFGSFKSDTQHRATQILMADTPMGPFRPISKNPQTPWDYECLDGTLWIESGIPYLVYSREWEQIYDGEICAVELTENLSAIKGEPFVLFKASDNPYVGVWMERDGRECYVTDGPYLTKKEDKIELVWSSFDKDKKYSIFTAQASSLKDVWKHLPPKYDFEGGHCMIFNDLNGKRKIAFHSPNIAPLERAVFLDVEK